MQMPRGGTEGDIEQLLMCERKVENAQGVEEEDLLDVRSATIVTVMDVVCANIQV